MPREQEEPVEIICTRKIRETGKAALYLVDATEEEVWFPKSHIEDEDEMDDGTVVLTVSAWIAKQKGLADE